MYNLVQGLILKGGVLNHSTVVFMYLFYSWCVLPWVSLCVHHCFRSQTFRIDFKVVWHDLNMNIKIMVSLWFGTSYCLMNVSCVWETSLRWDLEFIDYERWALCWYCGFVLVFWKIEDVMVNWMFIHVF